MHVLWEIAMIEGTAKVESPRVQVASASEATAFFSEIQRGFESGSLAPYIGPGVAAWKPSECPSSAEALAGFLGKKLALPKRARGNMWAAAQYVESQRHRATLKYWLEEAFKSPLAPSELHRRLAAYQLPLIVDTWYDSAMRAALSERTDWVELQGISRAPIGEARWVRAYAADGSEVPLSTASTVKTILYKPIGSIAPAANFIISDADYVEVLTEIDIQSPIPECVRERRSELGFVFLGCRFNEQTLRTYARQTSKRSKGPHYYIVDPSTPPTRHEQRFFAEQNMRVLTYPWTETFARLANG
jgi:hypothetical protein